MLRVMAVLALLLCVAAAPACAQGAPSMRGRIRAENPAALRQSREQQALDALRALGFDVDAPQMQAVIDARREWEKRIGKSDLSPALKMLLISSVNQESVGQTAYDLLVGLGMGDFDPETLDWIPVSDQVYAFDAEVYDVGRMYTHFLRGVQMIVPDVTIDHVQEDLSGMTMELAWPDDPYAMATDGMRSVSFSVNGRDFVVTLESYGDWINMDILDHMNLVLEKVGAQGRLYVVSGQWSQTIVLVYGGEQWAQDVAQLITQDLL